MGETKHTPGPWHTGHEKSQIIDANERLLGSVVVVQPYNGPTYREGKLSRETLNTVEANARLMARAPELQEERDALLAACKEALQGFQCTQNVDDYPEDSGPRRLVAAIAKAEGKE